MPKETSLDLYSWSALLNARNPPVQLKNEVEYVLDHPYRGDVSADAREFSSLLTCVQSILVKYIDETSRSDCPVNNYESTDPHTLTEILNPLVKLGDEARPDLIPQILETTLKYSVRTWSPRFMDKLYSGANPIGAITELIIGVLNTNSHVYHVSPVFTLVEIRVLEEMCKLIGFEGGRGVFCPGGSYSNLHAMLTARNLIFPEMRTDGVNCKCSSESNYAYRENTGPIAIFTSAHCHYSIMKSALALGIGSANVYEIPTDSKGKMSIPLLENAIKSSISKGERPFFISATAGTTVLGAFDPLADLAKVSKKYNCWFHVDGSWGGSAAFSIKHRNKMAGCEHADSVTINPHKILGVPLMCSALLMKNPKALRDALSLNAGYLFHDNDFDLGDATIGCGRRPDAFKMMTSWVYYGKSGFETRVNLALNHAQFLKNLLESKKYQDRFELVVDQPEYTNVCFWYYPKEKGKSYFHQLKQLNYQQYFDEMSEVTKFVHKRIHDQGLFMVDYAPLTMFQPDGQAQRLPIFLRVVFNHPKLDETAIKELVKQIDS